MIRIGSDDGAGRGFGGSIAGLRTRAQCGAIMLAVAIGVFVVGVGVAIAVPAVEKSVRKARATEIAEDLRDFARAFQSHARQRGSWPPATPAAGQIPAGMATELGAKWSQPTPMGLRYLWAPESLQRGVRYRATIVLWRDNRSPASDERRLFEEIDRQLDDGKLRSGSFQLGYRDQPFFVIEP
jgi:type II secretory pathway pseudopilin PulG